jgi:hypothetical protein
MGEVFAGIDVGKGERPRRPFYGRPQAARLGAHFSMSVAAPLQLKPGHYPTDVALRTVSEALAKAGSQLLEIEPGELMTEYRPYSEGVSSQATAWSRW